MAKLTASLTRKWSAMVAPDVWETAEVSFSAEDEGEKSEAAMALRAYVKAQVDAEMKRQKDEIYEQYGLAQRPAAVQFAEEVGATVEAVREEKPPLPNEEPESQPTAEPVRVPIDDNGNELKTFVVQSIEIAETRTGSKFGKVFGGPWKKRWVPAWENTMEDLFGPISDMDLAVVGPPFPVKALVQMGEYRGRPSPDKVVGWEKLGQS